MLNVCILDASLAMNGPIFLLRLRRIHQGHRQAQEMYGSRRTRHVLRDYFEIFFYPCTLALAQQIVVFSIHQTGITDRNTTLMNFVTLTNALLAVPFMRAIRNVLSRRPAALFWPAVTFNAIYDMVTYTPNFLKLVYTGFSMYATFGTNRQTFYAIQLLSVMHFSPTLRNVVRAVSQNITQLGMTAFFGSIVIYVFMVFGFENYWSDLTNSDGYYGQDEDSTVTMCKSMLSCYLFYIVNGLITGGGIGEYLLYNI